MKLARRVALLFLLGTVAAASGCRSNFALNTRRATPTAPTLPFDVQEVVAAHNRDAMRVTSFEAEPAVTFKPGQGGRSRLLPGGVLRGNVYAEPGTRNFRLVLRPTMQGDRFDIGSNNDRFWLWSPDTFGNADVYTCSYDETGAIPLSALYQPDWLMEAMGLAPLPEPGREGVRVRDENGDAVIEQRRQGPDGAIALKETIISGLNRRIAEHRLYQLDKSGRKDLVARAVVKKYEPYAITGQGGETNTLELPGSFQMIWPSEQVDFTVKFQTVRLNAGFDGPKQKMLFTLPEKPGSKHQDLRAVLSAAGEAPPSASSSSVRDSLPPPPSGVRLGEPVSVSSTGGRSVQRALMEPVPARANGPLLGDTLPRAPGEDGSIIVEPEWRAGRH